MVEVIDKERVLGKIKHEKSLVDFFTGAGTGLVASCFLSSASTIRTVVMIVGFAMIGIGWYKGLNPIKKCLSIWRSTDRSDFI